MRVSRGPLAAKREQADRVGSSANPESPMLKAFVFSFGLLFAFAVVPGQERAGAKKPLAFAEAVEAAKKGVEAEKFGAAIGALQAAIVDLQKKQRTAVLAALPKPDGWTFEDQQAEQGNEMVAASLAAMGTTVTRRYSRGEHSMQVDITANSPMVGMMAALFNSPALVEADGGEIVKYGPHRAILKKVGDRQELQLLMYDAHLIKVDASGLDADGLLKVFDQAFVDRLEKPLGR